MHRYQPRIYVLESRDVSTTSLAHRMTSVDGLSTFVFAETQFIAVTAYQNDKVRCLISDGEYRLMLKFHWFDLLFHPGKGAQYCDEYVCFRVVCLSAHITRKPHGRTFSNFVHKNLTSAVGTVVCAFYPRCMQSKVRYKVTGYITLGNMSHLCGNSRAIWDLTQQSHAEVTFPQGRQTKLVTILRHK